MSELPRLLRERILILDGAMGTQLQNMNLGPDDFGGADLEGCNENLVLTRPEAIASVHAAYFEAGADIVETNSFGAVRHVLAEYGLEDKTLEIARASARLAVAEARRFSTPDKPRFAAGALGPGTKTISVTGGITFDEVRRNYAEASQGLLEGGVDLLLLETQQDTLNIKASLLGFSDSFDKLGRKVPVILSVSIETMGTMLGGQTAEALWTSVENFGLAAVGLNCATGPDFMTDHLRTLAELSGTSVICYPNAGLPDEHGRYNESPEMVAGKLARFADHGWLNLAGGCCGTTPEHVRAMVAALASKPARTPSSARRSAVSGLEPLNIEDDRRPVLVGERTNVIGSKKFRDLIVAGEFETAAEIGRKQARSGAHIIDVCLANPDRDEKADMSTFLDILTKKVKAPLMIDTTDAAVLEEALKRCPGKCVINSINLEDGEERFEAVVPLARRYGASLVVGTIDEDKLAGMGVTRGRKLAIASRSYSLLTEKYGVPPEDIVFDPLVFPCATGDKNYYGSAEETIEGVRLIKAAFPRAKTILGVSNVSFGLPAAGREVMNAVFLHHCVSAGLDMAIVNTEKLARYATLDEEEKRLTEAVLFWKGPGDPSLPAGADPVAEFAAHFRHARPDAAAAAREARMALPIEERLARMVVEGSKEGLVPDLEELLGRMKPLEIINGPLMKGMDEVGRLFGDNRMIVAEVLQSAEVMKAAVAHLEPKMDHADVVSRGRMVLATVKGDVHDIGKNLVHIILKNNGFEIHDLGIKVAPAALIEAVLRLKPDLIGLSGLLVKSAQQMVVTAEDLKTAGVTPPILVGGAALSARFTASRIAPQYGAPVFYAKDAMMGLELANQLQDPARRAGTLAANQTKQTELREAAAVSAAAPQPAPVPLPAASLSHEHPIPSPPDLKRHVLEDFDLERIFAYINPVMLYGRHLGLKGDLAALLTKGDPKALELTSHIKALQDEVLDRKLIRPRAVVRFFPAQAHGDDVVLYDSPRERREVERFRFPRQPDGARLCLSDFVRPASTGEIDYVALFVVTCGAGIRPLSEALRDKGEYLKSHALQALAIESAEGFAELLHERLRSMWGLPDDPKMTVKEKFQARYRGIRVSPGYPACPDLEDQAKFWKLLHPDDIGVELTEGFMMDPEASVSALVFHHPKARYFAVGPMSAEAAVRGLAC
ncbi:MAG: methionine synthase [Elusimicrobia bacterium]|nr:methionine synthase [Elusimicrobiota bacterium]